jgi:hypothetical protein
MHLSTCWGWGKSSQVNTLPKAKCKTRSKQKRACTNAREEKRGGRVGGVSFQWCIVFILIEVEAAGADFEMAVLQKRILQRKAKVSEVLVF